jgi:hypothetical protein
MPETVEVLLWCVALATWLMMFLAITIECTKKLARHFRERLSAKRKVIH